MKKNRIFSARLIAAPAALILLSLAAGCVSLAADVTPPPDYTPPAPVNGTAEGLPTATAIPLLPPDTARGAEIFAQKCAACHGPEGLSDGEMSAQLPNLPPQIGKREVGLRANPADWFRLVSVGNLERMMPGFSGSLDERARWDVVAYALSLTITQEDLIEGRELFEAYCSACHALDEEAHTDLGDPGRLAGITAEQIAGLPR